MDYRKKLGKEGEHMVALHLKKNGFKIENLNYKKQYGEIDIIATKGELLVFVEVKRRKRAYFHLGELITYSKQRKIGMVAREYISRFNIDQKVCRFDVALIEGDQLTYLENAFS